MLSGLFSPLTVNICSIFIRISHIKPVDKYLIKDCMVHPVYVFHYIIFINIRKLKEVIVTKLVVIRFCHTIFGKIIRFLVIRYLKDIGKSCISQCQFYLIIIIQFRLTDSLHILLFLCFSKYILAFIDDSNSLQIILNSSQSNYNLIF